MFLSFNAPDAKYIYAVFINNVYQESLSVTDPEPLTNGRSISFSDLESNTEYDIFAWIDVDGDGSYGDLPKGYVTFIETISADVELSVAFMNFDDKQFDISGGVADDDDIVRCYWLLAETLDESIMDLPAGTEEERSQVTTMVGSVTGALGVSGNLTTIIGVNDFPVPANSSLESFGLEYDCYCFVENGLDGSGRNSGDYEAYHEDISANGDMESIVLTPIL